MDTVKILSFTNIIILANACIMIYLMIFMNGILKYLNRKNDIRKYEIDINCTLTQQQVMKELDDFINSIWTEYYLHRLGWKTKLIMTDAEQTKMVNEVGEMVAYNISPLLIMKLSRYYNDKQVDNVTAIDTLIATKVHDIVLNFAIDNRSQ